MLNQEIFTNDINPIGFSSLQITISYLLLQYSGFDNLFQWQDFSKAKRGRVVFKENWRELKLQNRLFMDFI